MGPENWIEDWMCIVGFACHFVPCTGCSGGGSRPHMLMAGLTLGIGLPLILCKCRLIQPSSTTLLLTLGLNAVGLLALSALYKWYWAMTAVVPTASSPRSHAAFTYGFHSLVTTMGVHFCISWDNRAAVGSGVAVFGFHGSQGHIKVHASGATIATHLLVFFATDIHCPDQCPLKLTNGFIMYVAPDYPDNEVNCQYECCTLTSRRCSFGCLSRPWHFYTCSSCIFPLLVKPFMCCFIFLCA